ncbi:hypothetical protein HGA91_06205 [candidate division WWE3 bacterium]|nr:hypothetical protein [candidate division WWE3 bacterium]
MDSSTSVDTSLLEAHVRELFRLIPSGNLEAGWTDQAVSDISIIADGFSAVLGCHRVFITVAHQVVQFRISGTTEIISGVFGSELGYRPAELYESIVGIVLFDLLYCEPRPVEWPSVQNGGIFHLESVVFMGFCAERARWAHRLDIPTAAAAAWLEELKVFLVPGQAVRLTGVQVIYHPLPGQFQLLEVTHH